MNFSAARAEHVSLMFATGLRVAAITSAAIEDLGVDVGHRILTYVGKGGQRHSVPIPAATMNRIERYLALRSDRAGCDRTDLQGPLFITSRTSTTRPSMVTSLWCNAMYGTCCGR